jgi:hypothetical protein
MVCRFSQMPALLQRVSAVNADITSCEGHVVPAEATRPGENPLDRPLR